MKVKQILKLVKHLEKIEKSCVSQRTLDLVLKLKKIIMKSTPKKEVKKEIDIKNLVEDFKKHIWYPKGTDIIEIEIKHWNKFIDKLFAKQSTPKKKSKEIKEKDKLITGKDFGEPDIEIKNYPFSLKQECNNEKLECDCLKWGRYDHFKCCPNYKKSTPSLLNDIETIEEITPDIVHLWHGKKINKLIKNQRILTEIIKSLMEKK